MELVALILSHFSWPGLISLVTFLCIQLTLTGWLHSNVCSMQVHECYLPDTNQPLELRVWRMSTMQVSPYWTITTLLNREAPILLVINCRRMWSRIIPDTIFVLFDIVRMLNRSSVCLLYLADTQAAGILADYHFQIYDFHLTTG